MNSSAPAPPPPTGGPGGGTPPPPPRGAGGGELVRAPAETESGVQPSVGDDVDARQYLGQHDRRVKRQVDDRDADASPLGEAGHISRDRERVVHAAIGQRDRIAPRVERALERPQRAIAELFRAATDLANVGRCRPRTGHRYAEAHLHAVILPTWVCAFASCASATSAGR